MKTNVIMRNDSVIRLRKVVIPIVSLFIVVVITESAIGWETPITIGPEHLEKDLTISGLMVVGSPSDETVEYIMAMNSIQAETVEIVDHARIELWSPRITLKPGFHAKPVLGDGYFRAGIPTFKVNCVNMVDPSLYSTDANGLDNFFNDHPAKPDDPDPTDPDTFRAFCENEIDILNHHFVTEAALPEDEGSAREQLLRFRLNHAWAWALPPKGSADLDFYKCLTTLENCITSGTNEWSDTFNESSYHTEGAISMVYFKHFEDKNTSYAKINDDDGLAPWVMINYTRSDTNLNALDDGDLYGNGAGNGILDDDEGRKAAHEHEFGHIFSVHHTWEKHDTGNPANIMNYGGDSNDDGYLDAVDAEGNNCLNMPWGDRAVGFWFEPRHNISSKVCQRWNRSWLDYDNDDSAYDALPIRELWSQVEIIMYTAKHFKETWAD